jgi:hypothetical protein
MKEILEKQLMIVFGMNIVVEKAKADYRSSAR